MRLSCWTVVAVAYALGGCGLLLDFDPEDSAADGAIIDGSMRDGGTRDGSATDAAGTDAQRPDGAPPDAGTVDANKPDAGPPNPCVDRDDGEDCSDPGSEAPLICRNETCEVSRCGDGFIDPERGEECEDGNEISGDGCEPFACVWSCESHSDCNDANPCTGPDQCDMDEHRCEPPSVTTGECDTDTGASGVCRAGVCVIPGCGDGTTDEGEECDDGDQQDGDGCDVDCQYSCDANVECEDADACDGTAVCDQEAHVCMSVPPPDCRPIDECHVGMCNADGSCTNIPIDADADGYLVKMSTCGSDCDDTDPGVYPEAPERCDGLDNDCDDEVDDNTTVARCFPDLDGDTYGDDGTAVDACMCPGGTITRGGDCYDASTQLASFVRPAQTAYFQTPWCIGDNCSFDYDCNEQEERRWTSLSGGCSLLGGSCNGSGWATSVPSCGAQAVFVECNRVINLLGIYLCTQTRAPRIQECR